VSLSQATVHLGSLLVAFALASPYVLLEFARAKAAILYEAQHLRLGHVHDGQLIAGGLGFISHATVSLRYGLGLATALLACVGAVVCVRRYRWQSILLLGFPLIYYCVIGIGRTTFVRYALPLAPFACVFAAVGCDGVARVVASRFHVGRLTVFSLLVIACVVEPAWRSVRFDLLVSRTDSRVLAERWLTPRLEPGDGVYQAASRFARLQLGQAVSERQWRFDGTRFVPERRRASDTEGIGQPVWVILFDSPLTTYTRAPRQLRRHIRDRYELVWMKTTRHPDARVVMDVQDAFFAPLAGHGYLRPGPDVHIYRRR
jgi:hypothetical protein